MDRHLPPRVPSGAPLAVPLGTAAPTEDQAPPESASDDRGEGLAPSPLAPYLDEAVPTPLQRARDLLAVLAARPRFALQAAIAMAGALGVVLFGVAVLRSGGPPVDPDLPFAPAAASAPAAGAGAPAEAGPAPEPVPGNEAELADSGSTVPGASGVDAEPVTAHVAGAVADPGVVVLVGDARAHEFIDAAGGPRPDADLDRVNLAAPVSDGSRLYVPAVGEAVSPPEVVAAGGEAGPDPGSGGAGETTRVAVNSATAAELEALPGVGPAIAEAIVSHRESQGPFGSVEELEAVRGIGPAKLEALREHATL